MKKNMVSKGLKWPNIALQMPFFVMKPPLTPGRSDKFIHFLNPSLNISNE